MSKMGKIISLSGIDGAGKSTQVELLSCYLISKNKRIYHTEEMFTYFLLKPLIKILRKTTHSPKGGPVTKNKSIFPKLWFVLAFLDIWIGYVINIIPKRFKYDYIIADRFYTDIWANLQYYGYAPKWAFSSLIRLLPNSDIPILLVVKPGTVRKREDDFPLNYYKKQSQIYAKLHLFIDINIIDANQQPRAIFKKIIKILNET